MTNHAALEGRIANRVPLSKNGVKFQITVPHENAFNQFEHVRCIAFGEQAQEVYELPMGCRIKAEGRVVTRDRETQVLVVSIQQLDPAPAA